MCLAEILIVQKLRVCCVYAVVSVSVQEAMVISR
jgi:hypothetical protein